MNRFPLLALALASLRARAGTAMLTIMTLALSTLLFVGVAKISEGTRASFEVTLTETDLIIGARSAPVNLLLASVFRIGNPPANISPETARAIAGLETVAWTVPLSLGDSHRSYRVVGTNTDYFEYYRYGADVALEFTEGRGFAGEGDVVLGADVARGLGYGLGAELALTHGLGQAGISDHDDHTFHVVGVLTATGTPVDQTVHVSLEGIGAIHGQAETSASVSALLVGLVNKPSVLRVKRQIDTWPDEALLAILPGQALGELWAVTGIAERALFAISGFVIVVGLMSALTSLLTGLAARRREVAVLRAVGARPMQIGGLLVLETAMTGFAGALTGIGLVQLGLWLGGPFLQAQWGIRLLGTGLGVFDLFVLLGVTFTAALVGCFGLSACGGGGDQEATAPETVRETRALSWEEMVPAGEEERLAALYAEQYAKTGTPAEIEEGGVSDVAEQIGSYATVAELAGERVRLPGYTVPFAYGVDAEITEFLLVPYYGACLHLPPPPPNQTVYVVSQTPIKLRDLAQAVWIEGIVRITTESTALADAAYTIELDGLEAY